MGYLREKCTVARNGFSLCFSLKNSENCSFPLNNAPVQSGWQALSSVREAFLVKVLLPISAAYRVVEMVVPLEHLNWSLQSWRVMTWLPQATEVLAEWTSSVLEVLGNRKPVCLVPVNSSLLFLQFFLQVLIPQRGEGHGTGRLRLGHTPQEARKNSNRKFQIELYND